MRSNHFRLTGDQAIVLRKMVRDARATQDTAATQPNDGQVVVVAGAKGGVGVTTLALRLAAGLAQAGPTIVADANLQQPDLALVAGTVGEPQHDLSDVLSGVCRTSQALLPVADNLQLLPGGWAHETHPEAAIQSMNRLVQELLQLASEGYTVVVDAGPGIRSWSETLWRAASQVMLVTTPERVSVLDAYAVVKVARSQGIRAPMGLLVNRVVDDRQAHQVHAGVEATCRRFLNQALPLLGSAPEDAQLAAGGIAAPADTAARAWAERLAGTHVARV